MSHQLQAAALFFLFLTGCGLLDRSHVAADLGGLRSGVVEDHVRFYGDSAHYLPVLGSIGGAAIAANTNVDENFQTWYQEDLKSDGTDDVSDVFKGFGEGRYVIPVAVGAYFVGAHWENGELVETPLGVWGERCMRSALLGAPPLLALQGGLGASRPGESEEKGSRWQPFDDSNSASGHAFIGALPFVNAAMMADDPLSSAAFWAGSTLPAISRINDNAHYLSQSFLGWSLAVVAAHAVHRSSTDVDDTTFSVEPWGQPNAMGLMLVWKR